MMKTWLLVSVLTVSLCAKGSNWDTVTATHLLDMSGTKPASGLLCFQATDAGSNPISFEAGDGGPKIAKPFCTAITDGTIGAFQVPDSNLTKPAGVYYTVTVQPGNLLNYKLVRVTASPWSLDSYGRGQTTAVGALGGTAKEIQSATATVDAADPSQYQTAVYSSGTTTTGVGPGTAGQVYLSGGSSAYPSFSSSVTAAVTDSGGQVYNVVAFGANTNQGADVNAAFTAAQNAMLPLGTGGTPSGTLEVPPGKYLVESTIGLYPDVMMKCEPGATFYIQESSSTAWGTVNTSVSGTTYTVTWVSGAEFLPGWAGQSITINGSNYTISSVSSRTSLLLTSSAGTQTGVSYNLIPRGTVNVSGTTVTWVSGEKFLPGWAGLPITINGSNYTIGSVSSGTALVLTSSAGTQTGVSYTFSSFVAFDQNYYDMMGSAPSEYGAQGGIQGCYFVKNNTTAGVIVVRAGDTEGQKYIHNFFYDQDAEAGDTAIQVMNEAYFTEHGVFTENRFTYFPYALQFQEACVSGQGGCTNSFEYEWIDMTHVGFPGTAAGYALGVLGGGDLAKSHISIHANMQSESGYPQSILYQDSSSSFAFSELQIFFEDNGVGNSSGCTLAPLLPYSSGGCLSYWFNSGSGSAPLNYGLVAGAALTYPANFFLPTTNVPPPLNLAPDPGFRFGSQYWNGPGWAVAANKSPNGLNALAATLPTGVQYAGATQTVPNNTLLCYTAYLDLSGMTSGGIVIELFHGSTPYTTTYSVNNAGYVGQAGITCFTTVSTSLTWSIQPYGLNPA